MKAAPFDYHRPDSVAAAAQMLAEFGEDAKILAGGQSLVPMLALRLAFFDHLIDISRLDELKGIEHHDGAIWIGAGTTDATVGADEQVHAAVPLLTRVTPCVGHFQIRSRGTFGGSIAHADPAPPPAVLIPPDDAAPWIRAAIERAPEYARAETLLQVRRGGFLHRAVGDSSGTRRSAHRSPIPGLDGPLRLRGTGIRPSPRRFRDRGRGHGRRTR